MLTEDFAYDLPEDLIAQQAAEPRDSARLLLADGHGSHHRHIYDLPHLLRSGDLLVLNQTRVIPARLHGQKDSGGAVELLLVHPLSDTRWRCMIRGRVRSGTGIRIADVHCRVEACHTDGQREVAFPDGCDVLALCDAHGHVPLPPYIRRADDAADRERYQTVFASSPGSVAAPTAGLHFTPGVLADCRRRGIQIAWVDLAVGPGTFKPVDCERVEDYRIHAEHCTCPPDTVSAIEDCRRRGGRVVAVGTTVVRTLETAARQAGGFSPYSGWTRLYLHPPDRPQAVDALLTNFHLPRSSLLMLVACFTGLKRLHAFYRTAIENSYRFYSYGDAMLWLPDAAQ